MHFKGGTKMRHLVCASAVAIVCALAVVSASAAAPANPPTESCIAFFSNGGAQAGFILGVVGEGPGAVGQLGSNFGTSGGNGGVAPHGCG
jgi:hypothetical protein